MQAHHVPTMPFWSSTAKRCKTRACGQSGRRCTVFACIRIGPEWWNLEARGSRSGAMSQHEGSFTCRAPRDPHRRSPGSEPRPVAANPALDHFHRDPQRLDPALHPQRPATARRGGDPARAQCRPARPRTAVPARARLPGHAPANARLRRFCGTTETTGDGRVESQSYECTTADLNSAWDNCLLRNSIH